ncbi:MAG TPA: hypothetical protein VGK42_06120 [Candidatus Dormibacteraeota bacterium]
MSLMDRDLYAAVEVLTGLVVSFLLLGLVGLRWRSARLALVVLGPLYSLVVFAYFLMAGAGSTCSGAGAGFRCWEVSYASTWGAYESAFVGLVMLLSFAPVASAWLRSRVPSVLGSIALLAAIGLFISGLWVWLPACAAVFAAAVAGPPSRALRPAEMPARGEP